MSLTGLETGQLLSGAAVGIAVGNIAENRLHLAANHMFPDNDEYRLRVELLAAPILVVALVAAEIGLANMVGTQEWVLPVLGFVAAYDIAFGSTFLKNFFSEINEITANPQ